MTKDKVRSTEEALKLALEALEDLGMKLFESTGEVLHKETFTAIKEALMSGTDGAQPEQEPVAWMNDMGTHIDLNVSGRGTPLYTTPPQRTWVGLTDEEAQQTFAKHNCTISTHLAGILARAIEAKLKEKNTHD